MQGYTMLRMSDLFKDGQKLRVTITAPFQEIVEFLEMLEAEAKKQEADFAAMKKTCHKLLARLPLPIHYYPGKFMLRCRPNKNDEENFGSVGNLSYNPNKEEVDLGRFNQVADPVFYASLPFRSAQSDGSLTTIVESCKELFDNNFPFDHKYFTLSRWTVQKPIPVIFLGFYGQALQNSPFLQNTIPLYANFLMQACNEEDNRKCKLFYDFFSEKAGKKYDTRNSYLITTAFYHALKERCGNKIGILYSSSMSDNNGLNVVVSKEIVDSGYLTCDHVVMFKAQRNAYNPKRYIIAPSSEGVIPNKDGNFRLIKTW